MKNRFSSFVRILTLALVMGWVGLAQADGALGYMKAKQTELTALIQDSSPAGQKKLVSAFDQLLDYDALAKDSLGADWAKLSADQQKEFQSLLTTLVQRAYTKNLRDTLAYEITFQGEQDVTGGKLVKTVAKHKTDARKEPIAIEYRVHQVGGAWRIFDIVTEGSSLVANYRGQFHKLIEKKGVAGLLERMKQKAAE